MEEEPISKRGAAAVAHLWDVLQVDKLFHLFQEISTAYHHLSPRVRVNERRHELNEASKHNNNENAPDTRAQKCARGE